MDKLKPCPFCGGRAAFVTKHNISSHTSVCFSFTVQCVECDATLPSTTGTLTLELSDSGVIVPIDDGRGKAIFEWNRRADDGRKADD